jgi:hypothetical protein
MPIMALQGSHQKERQRKDKHKPDQGVKAPEAGILEEGAKPDEKNKADGGEQKKVPTHKKPRAGGPSPFF